MPTAAQFERLRLQALAELEPLKEELRERARRIAEREAELEDARAGEQHGRGGARAARPRPRGGRARRARGARRTGPHARPAREGARPSRAGARGRRPDPRPGLRRLQRGLRSLRRETPQTAGARTVSPNDAVVSPPTNPVDPPDLELFPTVRRLLGLWREQWRLVAIGLVCALATTVLALAIPILISRAIDNAIVPKKTGALVPYLGAILVLAALRLFTNYTRRYATSRVGIRIEARMRELLYGGYLRFPRAFYDRHATGQVISRATNDLYPIRYFIGWGMVQGDPEHADDRRRRDRAARRRLAARADHLHRDAADRLARVALRAHRDADLAARAGAQGRRDRGLRRGRRRDPDGAGVRARGRRARALHHARRGAARHDAASRRSSRRSSSRASSSCRRSPSRRCCTSAGAR